MENLNLLLAQCFITIGLLTLICLGLYAIATILLALRHLVRGN